MKSSDLFDQMSDEQLIACYNRHSDKFNRAWVTCMSRHYRSAAHIDASVDMDRYSGAMEAIERYVYSNRPAAVHDQLLDGYGMAPYADV